MNDGFFMSDGGVLLALMVTVAVSIVVAKLAYREGYKQGQADFLTQRPPTEAERNTMLMKSVLPLWRQVGGWASIAASGLPFWVLMSLAVRYGNGSAWAFLAALLTSFVFFGLGFWLCEWFWRPYRKAQEQQHRPETDKGRHSS
ncbi:MAG: hypothetical protein Q7W02_06375 [Candidatus Rokubacteria bacterium]|nr:hypothetical protein [Candidatus Rokubacteria bacterium]